MQRMTSPEDELAALLERAYGPGADILDDPDALARLHELEAEAKPVVADTDTDAAANAHAEPDASATVISRTAAPGRRSRFRL